MHQPKRNKLTAAIIAALVGLLLTAGPIARAEDDSPAAANIFADAVAFAQPRCVKLYGAGIGREHGYATGIIVSADGQILCAQGIYLAGDRIRVVLADGSIHLAEVVRRSDALQAALLKIDVKTPKYFELPETCPAQKGDWVVAVSNLFKVAEGTELLSASLGIASLRTELEAKRGTSDVHYDAELLLIDAITSNPGAPGGAVVTVDGKLAGMIGKIIESTSTNTRLNYAVPADLLKKFVEGKPLGEPPATKVVGGADDARPGTLGIQLFTLGGKRAPAYVDRVVAGSPAEKAGIKKDDLVLAIGTEMIRNVADYQKVAAELKPAAEVTVLLKRDREILRITLTSAAAEPAGTTVKPGTTKPEDAKPETKPAPADKPAPEVKRSTDAQPSETKPTGAADDVPSPKK